MSVRRKFLERAGRGIGCALALSLVNPLVRAAPEAQQLLVASDSIRNPGQPFKVTVTLTEFDKGVQVDSSTLVCYSRSVAGSGQFASLIRFMMPARDAGKLMLKRGSDIWFFDPGTKSSVRLSPQQRLIGQASNGDVVTANFAKDYQATLAGEENIQDGERQFRNAYKLVLSASSSEASYAAIELWIDVRNNRPLKAKFNSDSGRLLKTAYFRKFRMELGEERPTETVIIDAVNHQSVTLLRFSDYSFRNIPESWFQRDFLPRFQVE